MTNEERLTTLEKELAGLKEQVSTQPQETMETLASELRNAFTKMTGQK